MAEAYPAKLERALRASGWDVSVSNQGIRGGTARDAVYGIDMRVPPGTNVTIVQFGINDRHLLRGPAGDIARSLEEIIRRVHAKGSAVILSGSGRRAMPPSLRRRSSAWTPSSRGIPTFITRLGERPVEAPT